MYRNIPLGFSDTLVGATPSPGLAVFASSRTRLTAWLFHSRWSLFLHIRAGRMAAAAAGAKVFLGVDFAWGLTYFRLPRIIIVQGRQRRVSVKALR